MAVVSPEDRVHLLRRQLKRLRLEKEMAVEEVATCQKKERVHALTRKQLQLATERLKGLERAAAGADRHLAQHDMSTRIAWERADSLETRFAGCGFWSTVSSVTIVSLQCHEALS
jgi:hypothetical protein